MEERRDTAKKSYRPQLARARGFGRADRGYEAGTARSSSAALRSIIMCIGTRLVPGRRWGPSAGHEKLPLCRGSHDLDGAAGGCGGWDSNPHALADKAF